MNYIFELRSIFPSMVFLKKQHKRIIYFHLRPFGFFRPLYQYEGANPPTSNGPVVQSGFPTAAAINLSVKCIAAASTGMKPLPLPLPLPLTRSPGTVSVMDLSTSSVTSTSPQV